LSSNNAEAAHLIRGHCLAHGRRKFSELAEVFPGESVSVVAALKVVAAPEEEARDKQVSAPERLADHQPYRAPILTTLKTWRAQQTTERLVAPHSSLGKAVP
jgi:transposase